MGLVDIKSAPSTTIKLKYMEAIHTQRGKEKCLEVD